MTTAAEQGTSNGAAPFLAIRNLVKTFDARTALFGGQQAVTAVRQVSLDIFRGETLALVGESGSGKTTLGRCLLRHCPASSGSIDHEGGDLLQLTGSDLRDFRRRFQMIFQNPLLALNPRQTVGACLGESLKVHRQLRGAALDAQLRALLRQVQLDDSLISRRPHELSGGQRQQVAFARALSTGPCFIAADEPTASLDAAIKEDILRLLMQLKAEMGLTLLLISHDLAVVAAVADRIAVMYGGVIVEIAPTAHLLRRPAHPYTRLLLAAASGETELAEIAEEIRGGDGEAGGCAYAGHCPIPETICHQREPGLRTQGDDRLVACHLAAPQATPLIETHPQSAVDTDRGMPLP